MSIRARLRNYVMWKRHALRVEKLAHDHPLKYLFLEVTRRCNLSCKYCGSSCTGKAPDAEMTVPEWKEVIQQVAADFNARDIMVAVTGGEPLLKEGVFDLFSELQRLGYRYGMVSNGLLLDRAAAENLVKVGIGSISMSMDALPELNDSLRGRGAAEKVAAAVRNLQDAGYKGKLEIISTITKPALPGLDQMRRHVAGMKVPLWRAAPVMPIGRAAENPELIPDAKDIRWMLEWMRSSRTDGMLPRPEFSEEGFLGNRFEGQVRPYLAQCRAGITVAGVRYDGRLGACPELTDAFDQGSVRHERLKTVWNEKYQVFRDRSWTRKGDCKDCKQFDICRGGALHLYKDTETPILRCLYLMCKETDNLSFPMPGRQQQQPFYK
jgi:radical SAM protein with 4Fe4S-binding SPASM domain